MESLQRSLTLLDSVVQFLTKASGETLVSIRTLLATVPSHAVDVNHFIALVHLGILQVQPALTDDDDALSDFKVQWDQGKSASDKYSVGFPDPDDQRLNGSTKTAAKRRMALLKRKWKASLRKPNSSTKDKSTHSMPAPIPPPKVDLVSEGADESTMDDIATEDGTDKRAAHQALHDMLGLRFSMPDDPMALVTSSVPEFVLPKQASYAGTVPAQEAQYDETSQWKTNLDPRLSAAFQERKLYRHQTAAIGSALDNIPTMVCTGTGSGKSLTFLLPVLNAALQGNEGTRSLLLFPTKALAQDQLVKLKGWLEEHGLQAIIKPSTLDGDTPHAFRQEICESCNVILTNPDTLHAAILPNWEKLYRPLLANLRYIVLDEAHMYTGVFGAHVRMILARLYRVATCLNMTPGRPCFLSCSATLAHPETHFRALCGIVTETPVNVVTEDFSPRTAKHFFVWNPPILDMNGKSLGRVHREKDKAKETKGPQTTSILLNSVKPPDLSVKPNLLPVGDSPTGVQQHRRHPADETALLLALAVSKGVRCIAFCRTRSLVEWVYERTIRALKQSASTAKLVDKVESYRGGYTKMERRLIERRLFQNELLGVVGTSALELGVDIGGVDLTLHCGFPGSHDNLIQQSGRAGRGANASTSLSICVCFNAPMDQHMWRNPATLLSKGLSIPVSMPVYPGLVQGHLLCAGHEFPVAGKFHPSIVNSTDPIIPVHLIADEETFGSKQVFGESLSVLLAQGSMTRETISVASRDSEIDIFKTHPSVKNPWSQVSIRSIEPVSYQIIDITHPRQAGRTDGVQDEAAVLDVIPYSRVFYHAHPGAIITHRNRRYRITSMNRPPAFGKSSHRSITLCAFAKPCNVRYMTRPLSHLHITVVKQIESVNMMCTDDSDSDQAKETQPKTPELSPIYKDEGIVIALGSLGGCGVVTIKRTVHGFKKLSLVTRQEISRSELSLPDMEFDTFAFWLDCSADVLSPQLGDTLYGRGVHALSHAMMAVAPLFVPCTAGDLDTDHRVVGPTKVCLFDVRAGGSGICSQLWKSVFVPGGLIEAAIEVLADCPTCSDDADYDGGCPGCIQAGECTRFNDFLSKSSGWVIGKYLLARIKKTERYMKNLRMSEEATENEENLQCGTKRSMIQVKEFTSPRREKRARAMRYACDLASARERQVVVGRPSWPMDGGNNDSRRGDSTGD